MTRTIRSALLLVCMASLSLPPLSGAQETLPASPESLKTFFTARSAKPDESLPEEVRKEFEDDDGSPLKSVAVDLDGNGQDEKFVLNSVLSGSGGSQWLVYDNAKKAARGIVVGAIIFIHREADDGYPRLETYWKQGGDMAIVFRYRFQRGRYVRVDSRSLTVAEINEYFRTKPPIDLDKELAEIKSGPR